MHQRLRSCCPESHRLFCLAHLSSVRGLLYWQGVAVWRGERGPAACVRDGCWGDLHDLGHRGTTHRGRTHQALLPGDVHTVPTQTASVPQEVSLLLLDYVMFTFFFYIHGIVCLQLTHFGFNIWDNLFVLPFCYHLTSDWKYHENKFAMLATLWLNISEWK